MSVDTEMETHIPPHADGASVVDTETVKKPRKVNGFLIVSVLAVLVAVGVGWYLYAQGFEDTDDAQVDGHLNPIASRIDGTIKAVHADDNQAVKAGEVLVELDPDDNQISLDQSRAQYDQAMAQLSASHPNLPITRLGNTNDLTSQQAEVVAAEAALSAAQSDLDSARAKLKESQAVDERSQADFARYQTLFDKQEVARADYDRYKATAAAQTQDHCIEPGGGRVGAKDGGAAHGATRSTEEQAGADAEQRAVAGGNPRGGHQEPAGQHRGGAGGAKAEPAQPWLHPDRRPCPRSDHPAQRGGWRAHYEGAAVVHDRADG